jgi:outer membrane protein OmpA-like peptidoglycan-associated protein
MAAHALPVEEDVLTTNHSCLVRPAAVPMCRRTLWCWMLGLALGAPAGATPLNNPSLQELQAALAAPASLTRSFTRTAAPTQDGLCASASVGSSSAASGAASEPSAGRATLGRNLEVVAYAPAAAHVDLAIVFANDSDAISPASRATLNTLAQALKSADLAAKRFVIAGHTSSTGGRERNLQLSCARSVAVRNFLLKAGVAPERLSAYGFGPDKPLPDTDPAADANRRVEVRVGP